MMGWEPIPWQLGFFASRKAKKGFVDRRKLSLEFVPADQEWPPESALADDFDFARHTGTGFVAETDDEKFFLIHRDWFGWPDPPEWGLVSQSKADGSWHRWGSFSDIPPSWSVPEIKYAQD
jgi:hypothetical protein